MIFSIGGVEKMRLTNAGYLGIGTNAPGALLDVAGTIRVSTICDGSGANCKTVSAGWNGTVTTVTPGVGLVSGNITTIGTLNVDVGTTANKIVQLLPNGYLPAVDGFLITNINAALISPSTLTVSNGGTGATTLTTNQLLVGNGTSAISAIAAGTTGQILQSTGAASNPTWSTPTYPSASGTAGKFLRSDGTNIVYSTATLANTATQYDLLYASAANTWSGLAKANTSALITDNGGLPTWVSGGTPNRLLRTDGTNITFAQATLTSDVTGVLPVANGGTGAATLTGANIFVNGLNSFGGAATLGTGDANSLTFYTNNAARISIDSSGNVGIGTTTPGVALDLAAQTQWIRGSGTTPGEIRFGPGPTIGSNYVGFKGPATNPTANVLWQLPAADGANGQTLKTNGSGTLSWGYGAVTILAGNSNNATVAASSTVYGPASGSLTMNATDTSGGTRVSVSRAGTVQNLYIRQSATTGNGKVTTYTVMKGGVASALTCQVTGNAGGTNLTCTDTTNTFAVVAGDELGIRVQTDAASTAVAHSWAMEIAF
jgi:fibronectin-binding autotransporter adhesin